jgi:hypothetical protein
MVPISLATGTVGISISMGGMGCSGDFAPDIALTADAHTAYVTDACEAR